MAGISVTLEGDNIQIAFQKGEQSTAVGMDPHAARSLVKALSQLLIAIGESSEETEDEFPEELVEVTSSTIDVGTDEHGMAEGGRSVGRRVGKECRYRWSPYV